MDPTAVASQPFTADELAAWRRDLVALRRGLRDDAASAAGSAMVEETAAAERTSVAQPSEVSLAELSDVATHLREIDEAIDRIDGREAVPFGICRETGEPIEPERLRLMPWTAVSLAGARAAESRSGRGR